MSDLKTPTGQGRVRPSVEVARFKSFSDGIFAIVLTIMIFNLKPPSSEGWRWVVALWPTIVAYALSYIFVGVCWLNHHYNLQHIKTVYSPLIWTNFNFLFWMSFLPFTTSYLAGERFSRFAMLVYALTFIPMVSSYMVLECATAFGEQGDSTFRKWLWIAMLRGALALVLFGAAAALAYPFPKAAFGCILATLLLYIFPEHLTRLGLAARGRPIVALLTSKHVEPGDGRKAKTDRPEA